MSVKRGLLAPVALACGSIIRASAFALVVAAECDGSACTSNREDSTGVGFDPDGVVGGTRRTGRCTTGHGATGREQDGIFERRLDAFEDRRRGVGVLTLVFGRPRLDRRLGCPHR